MLLKELEAADLRVNRTGNKLVSMHVFIQLSTCTCHMVLQHAPQ